MAQRTVFRQRTARPFKGDDQAHADAPLLEVEKDVCDKKDEFSSLENETYTALEIQTIIAQHIKERVFLFEDVSEIELKNALKKFVAFSIFGKENSKLACIDLVVESVIEGKKKLCKLNTSLIYCSVIYILGTEYTSESNNFEVPLFKLYEETDDLQNKLFIDITGKIYHSWKDFLDADDWFDCLLIAPKNGKYKHSPNGEIELQYVLKVDFGRGNREKIIHRNNLQETISKYSQISENFEEKVVDKVLYEITNNLMTKVEDGAFPSIDLYKKTEVFVDAFIFSKMIEKLDLTWHENVKKDLRDVDEEDLKIAKNKAKEELIMRMNDGELNRKFKEFWIGQKNLFLLFENDWKLVYGFKWDVNVDFEKLMGEIYFKKVFEMEILCKNNIYTIKFKDQKDKIKILVDESDGETGIGYMIVPTTLARTNLPNSDQLNQINNIQENSPIPFNGNIRDFMAEARKFQILVATYCEGQFNHRCLEKFDEEILQIFVGISIFGDKDRRPSLESNIGFTKEELDKINKIVKIIRNKNESFKKYRKEEEKNQIHYGVVQIVGFEYGNKNNKFYKTPVFKVFKNKDDENPILIDEIGNVFEDWDHFNDANYLPESLICVPRNGCYDLKSEDTMDLEFTRTIAYWSKEGRKLEFALRLAMTAGSLFLTFYTGPIAFGVTLGLGTRIGFGLLAASHGYKAYQMYTRKPVTVTGIEEHATTISIILNVGADVLAVQAETSLAAFLGYGALCATGFGLGAYVIYSVVRKALKTYKETGKINENDILSITHAALMCGNYAWKLTAGAGGIILGSEKLQNKYPLLKKFASYCNNDKINQLTVCVKNMKDIVNRADNICKDYVLYFRIIGNLGKSALEYANGQKNSSEFKNDCVKFCNDFVKELLHNCWPLLKPYLNKNIADVPDLMFKHYVEKFDIFKIKKWLDEKIQLNKIVENLLNRIKNNKKNIFNIINAKITEITKKLLKKISIDSENNIDKVIKTEVFVERAILASMFQKLQISWNLNPFQSINPVLLEKAFEDSVKDFENRLEESDFITDFRKYYYEDEDFFLLTNYDGCDYFVFENRTVQSVLKEFDNSCYKMKKEDNTYIITYCNTNKKVVLYLDDRKKNNIVGYMVAESLNTEDYNLPGRSF